MEAGIWDTTAYAGAEATVDGNIRIRIIGVQYAGRVQYKIIGSMG